MTFKTHAEIAQGRIDPAPMVDIVFLLLIFLVLSSPFVLQPGFGLVEMPRAAGATSASLQGLVVTISRDNLLFFNAQPTTLERLPEQLRQAARETRSPELILKADRQVGYETIVKLISIALDAGISAVNLATRPQVPVAPPK
jgi:biopolymer transport protein ExbD